MSEQIQPGYRIDISIPLQQLSLFEHRDIVRQYPISSAANGAGEQNGSYCTPRGKHLIRAKIGAGAAANTVFIGRRPSGEIFKPAMRQQYPERDWIVTRIIWLSGCEPGFNRLGDVDSMRRYIYLHGAPDEVEMGAPGSLGCIRMRNANIIELFELVKIGTPINIRDTICGQP